MERPGFIRRVSISTRIIVMVVGTLVLAQTVSAFLIHNLVRDYILGQKLETADILTSSILHDITYTGTEDLSLTGRQVMAKYMTYYRVISEMSLYTTDGTNVASSRTGLVGRKTRDPEILAALQRAKPSLHVSRPDLSNFGIRSISPILRGSQIIGGICFDVSIQDINETVAESDAKILGIMTVKLVVVVVALFVLFRVSILERLRRLMEMTRRLTLGNYATQTVDAHGDEIGELTRAFNHMATQMQASQQEIARHNRELEERVHQATGELQSAYEDLKSAQGQLVMNEKMASLGVLIAGVAHEINTPVGAILNVSRTLESHVVALPRHLHALKLDGNLPLDEMTEFLQALAGRASSPHTSVDFRQQREVLRLLTAKGIPEAQKRATTLCRFNFAEPDLITRYLECIRNDALFAVAEAYAGVAQTGMISQTSSKKIAEIVRALKCYAHTDSGHVQPMDVNNSITTALVLLRSQLKHSVDVRTQFDPELPPVACSGDIHQVWTNLLGNACDAVAERGTEHKGEIVVRTRRQGPNVIATIEDNGPGIPSAIMDRIFDPFFTTKDVGKGSGLGLSIVSGIVTRNHGRIDVESRPGRTVFQITLPIEAAATAGPVGPLPTAPRTAEKESHAEQHTT